MRYNFIFIFCLCLSISKAQQIDITKEPIDIDGYNEARIIGQDDDGFYVLQSNLSLDSERNRVGFKTRKLKISYFDGNLKPKWSVPAVPSLENGTIDVVTYAFEKLLLISSSESKSEAKLDVWIKQINSQGSGPLPGVKIASFDFNRNSDYNKLKFFYSTNQHYAVILLKENTENNQQVIHLAVLDSTLNLIYNHNYTLLYDVKAMTIEDYKVTNNGDIAMLGFLNKKEKNEAGNKIKVNEYHLFTIPFQSEVVLVNKIITGEKYPTQAGLVVDNLNNEAVVMGFYPEKSSSTGTGLFYARQGFKKNNILNIKTCALTGSQQQNLIGERNSTNSNGISNYPVQKIILRNDGGAVILAEAAYTSEYSYYDYFTQSLIRHIEYHYDNVVVVSVNNDCTIDWSSIIHKRQESTDDGGIYSSFCNLINQDEIVIIYNKDIEREQSASAAIISNRGDQKEVNLTKSGDHLLFLPTWGKQISENEAIIPIWQKKKLHLGKLSF